VAPRVARPTATLPQTKIWFRKARVRTKRFADERRPLADEQLGQFQYVIAIHRDMANVHALIAANRVHPASAAASHCTSRGHLKMYQFERSGSRRGLCLVRGFCLSISRGEAVLV